MCTVDIMEVELVGGTYGAPDRCSISKNGSNYYFIEG
jgi:hypothetical protein